MTRVFADPRFIAALAVVGGLTALSPAPLVLRAPITLPLALVLPGLALSLAFLPDSRGWLGRIPVSVATSVAIAGASGLLLKASPIGLTVKTWVPLLVGVTLVGAAIAARNAPGPSSTLSSIRLGVPSRPALALLATGALVVVAIALARTPLSAGTAHGYSALWMLPNKGDSDSIKVGVFSAERGDATYRLVVNAGGSVVFQRALTLSTGEQWEGVVDVSSIPVTRRSFDARLFKSSASREAYRESTLVLPGSTVPPTTGVWLTRAGLNTMRVLIVSAEPKRERFRLELRAEGRLYRVLRPRLRPGERWSRIIDFAAVPPSERSFEADLDRRGTPAGTTPYRIAKLVLTSG
jgi:uncharacterized membrane protein